MPSALSASIDARLAETDRLLATAYPGDDGSRQPVHTVYVPGDTITPDLPAVWGRAALAAAAS
ncbi:aldolase, partial [Agromyces binzhouensis]